MNAEIDSNSAHSDLSKGERVVVNFFKDWGGSRVYVRAKVIVIDSGITSNLRMWLIKDLSSHYGWSVKVNGMEYDYIRCVKRPFRKRCYSLPRIEEHGG